MTLRGTNQERAGVHADFDERPIPDPFSVHIDGYIPGGTHLKGARLEPLDSWVFPGAVVPSAQ